jgi:acetylornithine deacetylase
MPSPTAPPPGLQEAFDWIEDTEPELIAFLEDYIRYQSIPEEEAPVQTEFIKPTLEAMDWTSVEIIDVTDDNTRPNVNARLEGSGEGRNLLFNGHSDVVDVSPKEAERNWETDPWEPTNQDGRLYARGASDMKGPNTAMIWAAQAIMESEIELTGDLLMSIVIGEEVVEQDLGTIPATQAFLDAGHDIPFCINTEPTNNQIHTKSASLLHFDITIPGKAVHASAHNLTRYPQHNAIPHGHEAGVDTIPILTMLLEKLRRLEHHLNMEYRDNIWGSGGHPTPADKQGVGAIAIVPTLIDAGNFIAAVANRARVQGQLYIPPGIEPQELWSELETTVASLEADYPWLEDHPPILQYGDLIDAHRDVDYWPAFETPIDHPGCTALGTAIETATNDQPVYSGFKAVNDAGFIDHHFDIPSVSLGPGDTYMGAHGANEYIPLDQLTTAAKIYTAMIYTWCT